MAYGVPGIISFLSAATSLGIQAARAARMPERAVTWLLARERPADAALRFVPWFVPGHDDHGTRLS